MKKINSIAKILAFAAVVASLASCSKAVIDGVVKDAPEKEVVVKLLDVNKYQVLDTLKTSSKGAFSYKMDIEKGKPEFVYVFYGDTKIASLLLETGDRVKIEADTLGSYTVEGSEESLKLQNVENAYALFNGKCESLADRIAVLPEGSEQLAKLRRELRNEYVNYYRGRVRYVVENPFSLTVVPVFFQTFGDIPVFSQNTDALHFASACDSLETVYPESRYVKALRAEQKRREQILNFNARISAAEEIGYPDIELPDIKGKIVKLSEVEASAKVVLLHFWVASEPAQKMFNLDFLKKIYNEYHSRGLEIYQVSLDVDKGVWAQTLKGQELPWVNVCDGRGAASPYIGLYGLGQLPTEYLLSGGEFVKETISSEAALRSYLQKKL